MTCVGTGSVVSTAVASVAVSAAYLGKAGMVVLHEAVSLAAEAVLLAAACRLLDGCHGPQQAAAHALPLLLAPAHPGRLAHHLMYMSAWAPVLGSDRSCGSCHRCWMPAMTVDRLGREMFSAAIYLYM